MRRRDFLKSCGAAVGMGLPVLAVGTKSETFEARPGFVPAVVIPEPETENYSCRDRIISDEEYEQTIDELRRIREFEVVKRVDTLESLAAEFGWELEKRGIVSSSSPYQHKFQFLERDGINYGAITIELAGIKMPLRELFIVFTAKENAWAETLKRQGIKPI